MSLNQFTYGTPNYGGLLNKPWLDISVHDIYFSGGIYGFDQKNITWHNTETVGAGASVLPLLPNNWTFGDLIDGGKTIVFTVLLTAKQLNGNYSNVYEMQRAIEVNAANVWVKDGGTLQKTILLDYVDPLQFAVDFLANSLSSTTEEMSVINNTGSNLVITYTVIINIALNN